MMPYSFMFISPKVVAQALVTFLLFLICIYRVNYSNCNLVPTKQMFLTYAKEDMYFSHLAHSLLATNSWR
ncbi:hypothetical protein K450DRAFT_230760 [Umbelopsis ramanniana AG]|uniref:Uncharacterized protein n=1 Tax=Umbelopsis ramanniana AG TaxID=1314678 RepID=A0AAD5EEY7_UMBRA|nr:uncharacterized protein K450DRAFT_230760 [Umbelopsis ramanniana AG]KAI8581696.1 hypothetical protein K450DRAFT_230760 [Umbelopsis ramanniana AG]